VRRQASAEADSKAGTGGFVKPPQLGRPLKRMEQPMASSFRVRYQRDPKLDLSVPVEVGERYWRSGKPGDDRLEVESTCSDFGRFDVTTGEQIKIPK